jgi:hypothetical protein
MIQTVELMLADALEELDSDVPDALEELGLDVLDAPMDLDTDVLDVMLPELVLDVLDAVTDLDTDVPDVVTEVDGGALVELLALREEMDVLELHVMASPAQMDVRGHLNLVVVHLIVHVQEVMV